MWRAVMRIALVKPEKARQVEEMMLQMAKRGQIGDRVRAPPLSLGPNPNTATRVFEGGPSRATTTQLAHTAHRVFSPSKRRLVGVTAAER